MIPASETAEDRQRALQARVGRPLFWRTSVWLILGLTALEYWSPGTVPILREVTVEWYVFCLNRDNPRAAVTLGEMGPKAKRAVPALTKAIDFNRPGVVRGPAWWALGRIGPAAVPALINALDSRQLETQAARTLAEMGPKAKQAVPALVKALDSSQLEIHASAVHALKEMVPVAKQTVEALISALGSIGPDAAPAVGSLIRIQKDESVWRGEYLPASEALGKIGERGLAPFLTSLRDQDPRVRERAAESLGSIMTTVRDPRQQVSIARKLIGPLLNALQDDDARVRRAAAMAMQFVAPHINRRSTYAHTIDTATGAAPRIR